LDEWLASPLWTFYDACAALLIVPLELAPSDPLMRSQNGVAWVRWAAVADGASATPCLRAMFADVEFRLAAQGVRELWCVVRSSDWLRSYLPNYGYAPADRLFTYEMHLSGRSGHWQAPPADVSIRQATADDLEALCALDALSFDPPWRYPLALMQVMFERAFWTSVAVRAGQTVGYASSQLRARSGHIVRLAVHPLARRRGIGRALLCDHVSRLAQAGQRVISLNTQGTNWAAQQLYRQLGFRRLSEEAHVLRKSLVQSEDKAA
jgi:ribosomal-protein-alanine N-acetyltransferase